GGAAGVEPRPGRVPTAPRPSRYPAAVIEAVAESVPGGRVVIGGGTGSFGQATAKGATEAAAAMGLGAVEVVTPEEVPDDVDADVLVLAGSFDDAVAVLRRLRRRPRVVTAVAGGLREFPDAVGARRAEGVLAPSQWEEGLRLR